MNTNEHTSVPRVRLEVPCFDLDAKLADVKIICSPGAGVAGKTTIGISHLTSETALNISSEPNTCHLGLVLSIHFACYNHIDPNLWEHKSCQFEAPKTHSPTKVNICIAASRSEITTTTRHTKNMQRNMLTHVTVTLFFDLQIFEKKGSCVACKKKTAPRLGHRAALDSACRCIRVPKWRVVSNTFPHKPHRQSSTESRVGCSFNHGYAKRTP